MPPLVSGALVASFARAVADGLNQELLTHYYLPTSKVVINIDRVLDRLLAEFTRELWDELFDFYTAADDGYTEQVKLLFDGPIRQIVLILNGPETASCLLEHIGPGLSRRKSSWTRDATGIDLQLGLQLVCGFWHREYPNLSPGGSPERIAQALKNRLVNGNAAGNLVKNIRKTLLSPHYVQMHFLESAIWGLILKGRRPPPRDGFHIVQFRFECQLSLDLDGILDTGSIDISSLAVMTGSQVEHSRTTVLQYVDKTWQRCGRLLLDTLNHSLQTACSAPAQGDAFYGMAIWDGNDGKGAFCPGLRFLHVEVEDGFIQLSISAWAHVLIDVFQEMAWLCAALGRSPFPGHAAEAVVEVRDCEYAEDSMFFDCSMTHQPILTGEGADLLRDAGGSAVARGFPPLEVDAV